jgi:hypothetical protein
MFPDNQHHPRGPWQAPRQVVVGRTIPLPR